MEGPPGCLGRTRTANLSKSAGDARYVTGQTIVVDGGVTLPEYPPYPRA